MEKNRLEALSDGIIAIIITIMVLELKVPHGHQLADLTPLTPVLLSYVLSFVNVGIYWNNHHHLFQKVRYINGQILWANLYLIFWLSLIPFFTTWIGESHLAAWPVALYGVDLLMAAIAYALLSRLLIKHDGPNSPLAKAIGKDVKGNVSIALYVAGVVLSFVNSWLGFSLYIAVAIIWFVPDRRIERTIGD